MAVFVPHYYVSYDATSDCWRCRKEKKSKPAPADALWIGNDPGLGRDLQKVMNYEYRKTYKRLTGQLLRLKKKPVAPAFKCYHSALVAEKIAIISSLRQLIPAQVVADLVQQKERRETLLEA